MLIMNHVKILTINKNWFTCIYYPRYVKWFRYADINFDIRDRRRCKKCCFHNLGFLLILNAHSHATAHFHTTARSHTTADFWICMRNCKLYTTIFTSITKTYEA